MAKKTVEAKLKRQLKNAKRKLKRALPHDPDCKNDMRAARARDAIAAYRDLTGAKRRNAVSELICDLMHHCDQDNRSRSFATCIDLAMERYGQQTAEPFSDA